MTLAVLPQTVSETLRHNPIPALRRLHVEESTTEVTISGSLPSYYLKQLAQEAVFPLLKERRLQNRISVVRS